MLGAETNFWRLVDGQQLLSIGPRSVILRAALGPTGSQRVQLQFCTSDHCSRAEIRLWPESGLQGGASASRTEGN